MASRVIAQLILMGSTYVARAFVTAYQQALINSARQGGTAASGAARVRGARDAGMRIEEAAQVLGVRKEAGLKEIQTRYDRMFAANDPKNGGSLYLQAKIYNAMTKLEKEAVLRGEKIPNQPPPPSPPASRSQDPAPPSK